MTMYRFPEKKGWKWGFFLFLFLQLVLARDTMIANAVIGVVPCLAASLALLAVLGIAFLAVNRGQLKQILTDRRMAAFAFSALVLLVPMIVKGDWQLMYFSILLCIWFAIFLTYFVSIREAARCYVLALSILAVYSLVVTYLCKPLTVQGILDPPAFQNGAGVTFYNFGLSVADSRLTTNRNRGLFREPGVYQFFLILGLYLNNYTAGWSKKRQLWLYNAILAVTMLSTMSTNGVVELALFAVVLFLDKKYYKNKYIMRAAVVLMAALAVLLAVVIVQQGIWYKNLITMVQKLYKINASSSARYMSIYTDLMIFLKHPLFGAGVSQTLHAVTDNTTSTMILYAILGFVGGTFHAASWVALLWEKERKVWVNLAMLVILFMSFNTQNLTWDVFFWLFPIMALCEKGLPLLDRKRT